MDKVTYLSELEKELKGLSENDKENALSYYGEYIEDAISAGEGEVEKVFGSPRTLAAQIKADIAMSPLMNEGALPVLPVAASSAYTSRSASTASSAAVAAAVPVVPGAPGAPEAARAAFTSPSQAHQQETGRRQAPSNQQAQGYQQATSYQHTPSNQQATGYQQAPGYKQTTGYQQAPTYQQTTSHQYVPGYQPSAAPQKAKSGIGVIWTVILAILAIPVGIPVAAALFAVIVSVSATLFAVLVALAAVVIAFFVTGVVSVVVGIFFLFTNPPIGLFYLGAGLGLLGVSILVGIGFTQLARLCIKAVAKLFNAIRKKLTKKEKVAK